MPLVFVPAGWSSATSWASALLLLVTPPALFQKAESILLLGPPLDARELLFEVLVDAEEVL
ncbi:MAG: hypothetical protein M3252_05055, partial [Actinomycetota bacterium]|nr:hypothetical protein [Actinomycetota bacterium]